MEDEAFRAGTPEVDLDEQATVLMAGSAFKNKKGHALLTNDRVVFHDQRFDARQSRAVGGLLAGALAAKLEKMRSEGRPPMLDFPLTDITRVSHVTKMTVRDILVVETSQGEQRFSTGFKTWSPLLRRALTERHGRTVTDDGPDAWGVSG